ncbi:60S ribosomal protein l5-like [Trifolium pratense]|uniref:60S ribosomal protein l5-like n=1 Tax=Trifolium pratense TaxID=57577 RepID=A0A2K3MCK2_TRIPR|nr:60S ribosomal protein l5-like [Trifolium pratense]
MLISSFIYFVLLSLRSTSQNIAILFTVILSVEADLRNIKKNYDMWKATGQDYSVEPAESIRPLCALIDVGLVKTTTGNRVFGALKGALDIPHSDKRFAGFDKEKKKLDVELSHVKMDDMPLHSDFFWKWLENVHSALWYIMMMLMFMITGRITGLLLDMAGGILNS